MTLHETLILGSYLFTAGGYLFTWRVFREVKNHQTTEIRELQERVKGLEKAYRDQLR